MAQLIIDETKARALYKTADEGFKKLLESEFGDIFNTDIRQTIRSFEDACETLGLDAAKVLPCTETDPSLVHINAYVKLTVIAKALNEGWEPDWTNDDEFKWYPYFDLTGGSSVVYDNALWDSISYVGSRLCFRTRELAEYAGRQFVSIYQAFMI